MSFLSEFVIQFWRIERNSNGMRIGIGCYLFIHVFDIFSYICTDVNVELCRIYQSSVAIFVFYRGIFNDRLSDFQFVFVLGCILLLVCTYSNVSKITNPPPIELPPQGEWQLTGMMLCSQRLLSGGRLQNCYSDDRFMISSWWGPIHPRKNQRWICLSLWSRPRSKIYCWNGCGKLATTTLITVHGHY